MRFSRVLLTGATGFLGRAVLARLRQRGHLVTAVGRSDAPDGFEDVEVLRCDLSDAEATRAALGEWRWDALLNMAGGAPKDLHTWEAGRSLITTHVRITANLRQALPADWPGRLVHASGMIVYGIPDEVPVPEDHPLRPLHHYGLAKQLAEDILLAGRGLDRWVLRIPGLFAASRPSGALYHFIRAAQAGEPLRITATVVRPWEVLHVSDAADAVVACLDAETSDPGAVNIGYGEPVDLVGMARRIAARTGASVENTGGIEHPSFMMDPARARALLPWVPTRLQRRLDGLWQALALER